MSGPPPPADSAGTPWAGRTLDQTGFEQDSGAADPALAQALSVRAAAPSSQADVALVRVLGAARLLVPVVAAPGEPEQGEHGLAVEKSTEMAVVTLTAPDGRQALPVFSSVEALGRWDASARPVPVTAARAGAAAVAEGCQVIVIDVAGPEPTELRPSMVWALSQQRGWLPAHEDPFVARSVQAAVREEPEVVVASVEEGQPAGAGVLRVVLALAPGLATAAVQSLAQRMGERLATDGEFRARVDDLAFSIVSA